jgi:hypothetical protein
MRTAHLAIFGLAAAAGLALGQEAPPPEQNAPAPPNVSAQDQGGWRRIGGGPNGDAPALQTAPAPQPPPPAFDRQYPPPTLNIPAGTFIIVRLNEFLSSDRNRTGDNFTATLAQPLVIDGYTVANRGQLVIGVVADAQKAVHGQNVSRLPDQSYARQRKPAPDQDGACRQQGPRLDWPGYGNRGRSHGTRRGNWSYRWRWPRSSHRRSRRRCCLPGRSLVDPRPPHGAPARIPANL